MSVIKIDIMGKLIGIIDLEEIFQEVKSAGAKDREQLKDLILAMVKEKNYIPHSQEKTYRDDLYEEYLVSIGELKERFRKNSAIAVRLYGASCYSCEKLDEMVMGTLSKAGIMVDYQYITDMREVAQAGIISTPALTVSGTVVVKGQVPAANQLEKMLLQAIEKARDAKG